MRTEKKKSVYMYMYIFNVPGICEENDDETDYCNLVQDLYFPHSILFVGYGSWKHQEIGDDSCVDKW